MNYNISQVLEAQKLSEELQSEQIGGAGIQSAYLVAEEVAKVEELAPAIDISNIRASLASAQTAKSVQGAIENLEESSPNYILNKPLREAIAAVKSFIDPDLSAIGYHKSAKTSGSAPADAPAPPPPPPPNPDPADSANPTPNTDNNNDNDTDSGDAPVYIFTVDPVLDEEGRTTGECTYKVTDPDGTVHYFDSKEEAEEYLRQESEEHGVIIVGHNSTNYQNVFYSDVYVDGELVESFGTGNSPNGIELAQEWCDTNAEYLDDDLGYIYEYNYGDIDENSSEGDVAVAVSDELDRTINDYNPEDFYYTDENGFLVPDAKRLADWQAKVSLLCGILVAMEMLMKNKFDMRRLIVQELSGLVSEKGMDTGTIIAKWVQNRMAKVGVSLAKLFEDMMDANQKHYDELMEAAKKKNDSCGEKTEDFFSGGNNTIEMLGDMRRATSRFLDATKAAINFLYRTGGGVNSFDLGNSDTGDVFEALENGEATVFAELPSILYEGDNGYLELDDERLVALRSRFYLCQNVRKAWNLVQNSESEMRNLVHEEMTGVGGRERSKAAGKLQEMEDQWKTQLFDTEVNQLQQKMSLYNQKKYLGEKLVQALWMKYFNIVSLIAMFASIVVGFFSAGIGLVFSLFAAGSKLYGELWTNSVIDRYKPDLATVKPSDKSTNTGNVALDIINHTNNAESNVLIQIDKTKLESVKDGFKQVDYAAIAELQDQLTKISNIRTALVTLYKERASLRKLVHMEMTQVGARESSDYVDHMNKGDFFKLELATFMLSEVKNAFNMEHADNKQVEAAWKSFAISTACAIACAVAGAGIGSAAGGAGKAAGEGGRVLGKAAAEAAAKAAAEAARAAAAAGASVGYAVGQALGGLIASILNNTVWGSYDAAYGSSDLPAYFQAMQNSDPNSTEGRLEALKLEIYEEMLKNGTINTGDGYKGINTDLMTKLHQQLGRIANVRAALASIRKAQADARNLVHLEMTSISGRRAGEYVKKVNRADAENSLRVFNYLTRYMGERIEVMNRARNAEKALKDAGIKLGIDALLIVACSLGGKFGWQGLYYIMSPVMQFVNSLYDMVVASLRATKDMGDLKDHQTAQTVLEIAQEDGPNSTMNRLNRLEQEALAQISKDLIEELGAGRWGLNSGTMALFRHKIEKIFNIRDVFARVQAAEAEARAMVHAAMTGKGGRVSEADAAFNIDRMITQAMVRDLFQKLQLMVQRHNQMNAEIRAAIVAAVMTAWAAINIYLSVRSVKNQLKMKKLHKEMKVLKKEIRNLNKKFRAAVQAKDVKKQNTLKGMLQNRNKTMEGYSAKMKALAKIQKKYAWQNFLCGQLENLITLATGLVYDAAGGKRESKTSQFEQQVKPVGGERKSSGDGWVDAVADAEENMVLNNLAGGDAMLGKEAAEISIQQSEESIRAGTSSFKQTMSYLKTLRKTKEQHYVGTKAKKKNDTKTNVPVSGKPQVAPQNAPAAIEPSKNNTAPNSKVLLDRLESIIKQSQASVQKAGTAVKTAQAAQQSFKDKKIKDLKQLLKLAKAQLKDAQEINRKAIKAFQQAQNAAKEFNAKVGSALKKIDNQLKPLKDQLKKLQLKAGGKPDAVTAQKIKQLQTQIQTLELRKKGLELKGKELARKVAAAKQEVANSKAKVQEAVKQVNTIIAAIEKGLKAKPKTSVRKVANKSSGGILAAVMKFVAGAANQGVVANTAVVNNQREKQKSYYEMYKTEVNNQQVADNSRSKVTSAV